MRYFYLSAMAFLFLSCSSLHNARQESILIQNPSGKKEFSVRKYEEKK